MIGLKEMRRQPGRFVAVTLTLGLLAFLMTVLTGLSDGLFYGSTGAVGNSNAQAYAFSSDANSSFIRSQLPRATAAQYAAQSNVQSASALDVVLTSAEPSGDSSSAAVDVAVFGVAASGVGYPATIAQGSLPTKPGQALVDSRLTDAGLGDTLTIGDQSVRVVGISNEVSYQLQPTVWVTLDQAQSIRDNVRPELRGTDAINAVALRLQPGADASQVVPVSDTSVVTSQQAALAIPGVQQQRSTLTAIIATTVIVSAVVVVLFFILLVIDRQKLLGVLKAIGTSNRRLLGSVVVQAILLTIAAALIGIVAGAALASVLPATIPLQLRAPSLVVMAIILVVAGAVGSLLSARRVLKIDPAIAVGGQE